MSGTGTKTKDRPITDRPVRWRLMKAAARVVVIATPPLPLETPPDFGPNASVA
jgi:hypothetical protein